MVLFLFFLNIIESMVKYMSQEGVTMAIYEDTAKSLIDCEQASEFYRFQGKKSVKYFDVEAPTVISRDAYIYLSRTLSHHEYFTVKRLRQVINQGVLSGLEYQLTRANLANMSSYRRIRNLIINSDQVDDLHSIRIVCDKSIEGLIQGNCICPASKNSCHAIELADKTMYGGGYGLKSEWITLLSYMTYFNAYQRITKDSLLQLLANMRRTGKIYQRNNIDFLLTNPANYNYEINPYLLSDFNKYNIMNCLGQIIDNGSCLPDSELAVRSSKTIKGVVKSYERGKEKVLRFMDEYYKKENH